MQFVWITATGPVVPEVAFAGLLDLGARGIQLVVDGGDLLLAGRDVTDEDRRFVRQWRWHLQMLLAFRADDRHLVDRRPRRRAA